MNENGQDAAATDDKTAERLDRIRSAVRRWREQEPEAVAIMCAPDNFLAHLGIGEVDGARVVVHEGCTIVDTVGDAPDVPITGSRIWISTLDAVLDTAGLA